MHSPFHRFTIFGALAFSALLATRALAVEPTPPASPTVAKPADCETTAPGRRRTKDCAPIPKSTTPSSTPTTPSKKAPTKASTDETPALPQTNDCNNQTQPGQTLPQSNSQCSPTNKSAPSQGGMYGH